MPLKSKPIQHSKLAVNILDLDVKLYVIDKDKALYQDQGKIMWKSTLYGSSIWNGILCTK
ncbi:hypothetical protein MtrunA17_Chr7g0224811 [Medicago truncatula]|nr:hypothetical protein MtrunA17_Chr7g0224811 [Medicago truncatula]